MKKNKFVSLLLAMVMAASLAVPAFAAADPVANNPTNGSIMVSYTGTGEEKYTVTAPASLAPGESGTITLAGTWAADRQVTVSTDETVMLFNDRGGNSKVLSVLFVTMSHGGNDETEQSFSETIGVSDIENALFGTWSGVINYNVSVCDI